MKTEKFEAGKFCGEHLTNPSQEYFTALYNHAFSLKMRWDNYCELYDNEEYVALMKKVAPVFFAGHQVDLIDHTMMAIARLTDPPASGSKDNRSENLSITRLPDCLIDDKVRASVKSLLSTLEKSDDLRKIRDWRNKEGGHNDLLVATGQLDAPRVNTKFCYIENVLSLIQNIITVSVDQSNLFSYVRAFERGNWHLMQIIRLGLEKAREDKDPMFETHDSSEVDA